jgi:hypothetical protein
MTARRPRSEWTVTVAVFLGALAACDRRDTQVEASACPPCECVCNAAEPPPVAAPVVAPVVTPPPDSSQLAVPPPPVLPAPINPGAADLAELVATASREMMHDDGEGCLADLDRIAAIDAKLDARMAVTRGQCEMLVGRCQAGKARIAGWYRDEMAMHAERAAITAETIGSMRCRDGDSTDRDRLLRAFYELSDGAYMNKQPSAACKAQLDIARRLIPKVPPSGPEDGQISGGAQALFYTAATCFAHADDCRSARAVYRELFPAKGLAAIADPAERDKVVAASFESTVTRCAGQR